MTSVLVYGSTIARTYLRTGSRMPSDFMSTNLRRVQYKDKKTEETHEYTTEAHRVYTHSTRPMPFHAQMTTQYIIRARIYELVSPPVPTSSEAGAQPRPALRTSHH
jgi:hypothetical protein